MIRFALFALLGASACVRQPVADLPAAPAIWGRLTGGPYHVGVSVIAALDSSRPGFVVQSDATPPPGRPLQIVVWYPAERGGRTLALRDYVELSAGAIGPDSATAERKGRMVTAFAARPLANGSSRATVDSVLQTRMRAASDAPHIPGRFPLVLFLHTSPWGASVMSEYLASHGFVVAAIESKGARDVAYRLSRENLDAMVADGVFAITRMRRQPYVSGQLGIIGMSNGAIAAVATQLSGIVPQAIVSLDGGIGERAGGTYLNERTNGTPAVFTVPLLHLYTPDNPALQLQHIRSYQSAPRMLITVGHLRHGDFLTGGALERIAPGFFGPAPANASIGFEYIARYTYHFLRSHLTRDAESTEFLLAPPYRNGAPGGLLEIERIASERPAGGS